MALNSITTMMITLVFISYLSFVIYRKSVNRHKFNIFS